MMTLFFDLRQNLRSHSLGIKPEPRKHNTLRSRIMPSPVPPVLDLPLNLPGLLSPPTISVQPGQHVKKYEALALNNNDIPCLFAPTSGHIETIELDLAPSPTMRLRSDGEDDSGDIDTPPDYRSLSHQQLLGLLCSAGIMDRGADVMPLSLKLELGIARKADLLVVNAMECEPDVSANECLIREYAADVVAGAEILHAASLTSRCLIAIGADKHDAITALKLALQHSSVELVVLPDRYPAGHERVLTQTLSGLLLDWWQLPQDAGLIICDAGTARHVRRAVIDGLPSIDNVITVTGNALRTPKNFLALTGTPISYLLKLCGAEIQDIDRTIVGDSLTGKVLTETEQAITHSITCLIATSAKELQSRVETSNCIRCGKCVTACAADLDPASLYDACEIPDINLQEELGLLDCIECGACAWACPSRLPLLAVFGQAREGLIEDRHARDLAAHWQQRYEFFQHRHRDQAGNRAKPKAETNSRKSNFSREQAREEIAAAVTRVKKRKQSLIASSAGSKRKDGKNG